MKRIFFSLVTIITSLITFAQVNDLKRSTPAQEGVNTIAVNRFIDSLLTVPKTQIHHVMVLRHGKVIAEAHPVPYRAEDAHTLYSCSKTFVSLAAGIAIGENRLRLTDRVATFFPHKMPATISNRLASMTVRDVMIMASGIKPDWVMRNFADSPDWIKEWLAKPVEHEPGTMLQYDSMCTYMLSAIIQKVTGKTVLEYLNEHVFGPMNITEVDWEQSPDGINTGGWGLRLQAESLAKVGMLMNARGMWNGKQLVPAEYFDEALKAQINYANVKPEDAPSDKNQGYCYQLWRCKDPRAFRADGAFGQYIVCVPNLDIVVVILGMSGDGHGELACIWNQLLPGVDEAIDKPERAQKKLEASCTRASLPLLKGKKSGKPLPITLSICGNDTRTEVIGEITIDENYNITMDCKGMVKETIALSNGKWLYTDLKDVPPYSIEAVDRFKGLKRNFQAAGCYAWESKDVLVVRIEYVNWISATTLRFDFKEGVVTVTENFNSTKPKIYYILGGSLGYNTKFTFL